MFIDRLVIIRNHLQNNVQDDDFSIATWAGSIKRPWNGNSNLCGTVACIIGHATTIPEFQELGFRLKKFLDSSGNYTAEIYFNGYHGRYAIVKFLDMPYDDVEYLFYMSEYPNKMNASREEVISRIDSY